MPARKTARRTRIITKIMDLLRSKKVFDRINIRNLSEEDMGHFLYTTLLEGLEGIHADITPGVSPKRIILKADKSLLWEGDTRTTINNFLFFGVQHRPDFEIQILDLLIAIEIKRGETGKTVREGLGQCLVYSNKYDFVVYLYVDISKDKKILRAIHDPPEQKMLDVLWEHHNIYFNVV